MCKFNLSKTVAKHIAVCSLVIAASSAAFGQARYSFSADGSEVLDSKTSLTWQRCAVGMVWSGSTCTGTAGTFKHEQALVQAKTQASYSNKPWRLPNVKELGSIADKTKINPAIDVAAFPATPSNWFWSSSPYAGYASNAWYVNFYYGSVDYYYRTLSVHVRLVR